VPERMVRMRGASVRKVLAFVSAVGLVVVLAGLLPGRASAATQTVSPTFTGSGSQTSVLSALAVCDPCAPDALFSGPFSSFGFGVGVTIQAQASWSNPSTIATSYTQSSLRHGQTLDLTDTLTPAAGSVTVDYSVTGDVAVYGSDLGGSDESCAIVTVTPTTCNDWVETTDNLTLGPLTASDTIPCAMPLPGDSPRTCTATKSITLFNEDFFGIASAEADLILDESVTVMGTGVSSLRIAVINGGPTIPDSSLTFDGTSPSTVSDPIQIGCSEPVGNDLIYSLTDLGYSADPITYSGDLKFHLTASVLGIGAGFTTPAFASTTGADLGPIAMSAPDQQVDLGPVLANNLPPTANSGGPYAGSEGSPITFDGSGSSSVCGLDNLTLAWKFSDGGIAFGLDPQHTFEAPGVYSGELTATDSDGNVATSTFSIDVANLPPVVHAGPDMSTEWGVPITLQGSAHDPGTDEQQFLTYSWDFGDGSPSASGGASATHAYVAPGTYVATLTACDPENACTSDTADVVVTQRSTTTTYTGPNKSTPSKTLTLSATVVDDLGQPVAGRTVTFTLGAQSITATTNSSGVASAALRLNQKHGTYTATATFAPPVTDKYTGSTNSQTFTIGP
jgi:hypothetical protein